MQLGCTYLIVKDMKRSIAFYEALLNMKADSRKIERWAQFTCGNTLALWNPEYDKELIRDNSDVSAHFNEEYLKYKSGNLTIYGNNVILNFNVADLNAEYERVKSLELGTVTEIFFINIVCPYYCFMLEDPDGNLIEITGHYQK
ncbi:VOC family protein [Paenibacillus tianjinensis]|uniref:VOC family protein n=1 Tax=Paenibacillus tianjinensis TaxID=2810347 RepID=A0ABX7LKC3_9BACL|nr:VOC family protein [Paenibacillus tianjinensis]QSF46975.1 VOC family protein [Paenibacillus tianjinensis]